MAIIAITSDNTYVILPDAMLAIAAVTILMGYRWVLPKWSPSVYRLESLSNISRFFLFRLHHVELYVESCCLYFFKYTLRNSRSR